MEHEAARQWRTVQHQFSLLQREVCERTTPVPGGRPISSVSHGQDGLDQGTSVADRPLIPPPGVPAQGLAPQVLPQPSRPVRGQIDHDLRLQHLSDSEDVEHYLITFERVAVACQWPTTDWAVRLAPLLTGKARAAYVSMDQDDALEYEWVKEAILDKYINKETYRLQFRGTQVGEEETPKELYVRLRDLYQRWVQPQHHTKEQIGETIILEQFLRLVSPELQVWIRERNPVSAADAATLADVFVSARHKAQPWTYAKWKGCREANKPPRQPPAAKMTSSEGKSVLDKGGLAKPRFTKGSTPKAPVCYQCGQEGHIKPKCPNNPDPQANLCTVPRDSNPKDRVSFPCCSVVLNGQRISALVDTGSMQSLVSADLVPAHRKNYAGMIELRCVHGEERSYPTASVHVEVLGQMYLLKVGVVDGLPYSIILGQDFPALLELVPTKGECNIIVTRAMARKRETEMPLAVLPWYDSEIEAEPGKTRKSKRQRRQEKFQFGVAHGEEESYPELPEVTVKIPQDMGLLQQQDPEINLLYQQAQKEEQLTDKGAELTGQSFSLRNGVLYKGGGREARMVVPQKARDLVLELGHSVPWAGHLGRQKTIARVRRHFYWPAMARDIAEYCRTCPECQKTTSRCPPKVPLEPLPIVGTPFEQLGMDVVGPLERSKTGNRFMLVITDLCYPIP